MYSFDGERISDRAGGERWIAYRFADSDDEGEENVSPMYVRVILAAIVDADLQSNEIPNFS